jgi:hypothetical protein
MGEFLLIITVRWCAKYRRDAQLAIVAGYGMPITWGERAHAGGVQLIERVDPFDRHAALQYDGRPTGSHHRDDRPQREIRPARLAKAGH